MNKETDIYEITTSNQMYRSLFTHLNSPINSETTNTQKIQFYIMISLTMLFFIVELVIGIQIKSLALQTDAFHMLSDVIALIIGLHSTLFSNKTKNLVQTYGWSRSEIIGAFANSIFLLSTCFNIFLESIFRFANLNEVKDTLQNEIDKLLIVGGIGLFINLIGLFVFSHGTDNLNIKAVFIHVIGDTLGSIGVILSGIIIKYCKNDIRFISDPICGLCIICVITFNSTSIMKKSYFILLQSVPRNISNTEITSYIENIEEIRSIHELHIWQLNMTKILATMHIVIDPSCTYERITELLDEIKLFLHSKDIHESTIQVEFFIKDNYCREPVCLHSKCIS